MATEIEQPFGYDANDLPIEQYILDLEKTLFQMLPTTGLEVSVSDEDDWSGAEDGGDPFPDAKAQGRAITAAGGDCIAAPLSIITGQHAKSCTKPAATRSFTGTSAIASVAPAPAAALGGGEMVQAPSHGAQMPSPSPTHHLPPRHEQMARSHASAEFMARFNALSEEASRLLPHQVRSRSSLSNSSTATGLSSRAAGEEPLRRPHYYGSDDTSRFGA